MDFFNIKNIGIALLIMQFAGISIVSQQSYAQCKEVRSRTTGEVTKYVRYQVKGAAEQIIISNTAHLYKISYENKLNNDPRFRVRRGDSLTVATVSGSFAVPITESINVANGYTISAELTRENLIALKGLKNLSFPSSDGVQLVVVKKRKSQKLSIAINCLNQ